MYTIFHDSVKYTEQKFLLKVQQLKKHFLKSQRYYYTIYNLSKINYSVAYPNEANKKKAARLLRKGS